MFSSRRTRVYDYRLRYAVSSPTAPPDVDAPDIFTALQEQLGLRLEKSSTQLDVLVVDHLDRLPVEN